MRLFAVERSLHELLLAETDGGSFAEAWGIDRIRQASRSAEKAPERRQVSASPPGAR